MKKGFAMFVGVLFLTAALGVFSGWAADTSMPSVPGAAGTAVQKATEKAEALKGGDKKKELIDINSASLEDLRSLKGIGEKRAKDIVKNRPYARKDELVQKKIIPQKAYDDIKDQIIAKQAKDTATKPTDVKSQVSGAVDSLKDKK